MMTTVSDSNAVLVAEEGPEMIDLDKRHELVAREKMQAILLSTFQSLTVGVLAVGRDGVVIAANPPACRLFDRSLDQLATQRIDEVLAQAPGADELVLTLQGNGPEQRSTHWITQADYEAPRHVELVAVRSPAPYDSQLAGVVLAEDQTQLRRLEQQAALRSRLTGMGEIATRLAHEIRNPLGSIALFASVLEDELAGDQDLGSLASQLVSGVKSLEHIVTNTLEFARPRRMSITRVNLAQVVADALVYVEHPVAQKSIHVGFDLGRTSETWIAGDGEQLRQVFLNLILNAIQAMDEGGELRIGIQRNVGDQWEVTVSDDGAGIPEELLGRIFDPFFTTREKGSGIGLAVVHSILEGHDAHIEVESTVGAGATFRVCFPEQLDFQTNHDGR